MHLSAKFHPACEEAVGDGPCHRLSRVIDFNKGRSKTKVGQFTGSANEHRSTYGR